MIEFKRFFKKQKSFSSIKSFQYFPIKTSNFFFFFTECFTQADLHETKDIHKTFRIHLGLLNPSPFSENIQMA